MNVVFFKNMIYLHGDGLLPVEADVGLAVQKMQIHPGINAFRPSYAPHRDGLGGGTTRRSSSEKKGI